MGGMNERKCNTVMLRGTFSGNTVHISLGHRLQDYSLPPILPSAHIPGAGQPGRQTSLQASEFGVQLPNL